MLKIGGNGVVLGLKIRNAKAEKAASPNFRDFASGAAELDLAGIFGPFAPSVSYPMLAILVKSSVLFAFLSNLWLMTWPKAHSARFRVEFGHLIGLKNKLQ